MRSKFFALRKKQLHAKADSKEWLSRTREVAKRFDESACAKFSHSIAEGTDTWQYQGICILNAFGFCADLDIRTFVAKGLGHTVKISDTIVDHQDFHTRTSIPR